MIDKILQSIRKNGGDPFFVGGCVRDKILGKSPKDFDIEVFGIESEKLGLILSEFGKVNLVGSSFGIIKLNLPDGTDFDFSLPRRENKAGLGHKGFIIQPDATMTIKEAASRRDFTFNALAQNPFTGEILDFFDGKQDLENKILRHTSVAFAEDALRVLRAMQFAGRFDLIIHPETATLCETLKPEFSLLAKERIWEEFWKWACKSVKPSKGLQVLVDTGWIELFPEINNLKGCLQDPIWHPEGDVFTHTQFVCDSAVEIAIRDNLPSEQRGILVLAALCHDMGKPKTTIFEEGHWKSPGHDKIGEKITIEFLTSIGCPHEIMFFVAEMTREHMVHVNGEPSNRVVRRFLSRLHHCNVAQIMMIIEADHSGRPPLAKGLPKDAAKFSEISSSLGDKIEPILMGRHLLELGFKPGPEMGKLLKKAFEAQIEGEFSNLKEGLTWIKS